MKLLMQKITTLLPFFLFPYLGQKIETGYARVYRVEEKTRVSSLSNNWGSDALRFEPITVITFKTGHGYVGSYVIEGDDPTYNELSLYMVSFKKHRNQNKKAALITKIHQLHPSYAW